MSGMGETTPPWAITEARLKAAVDRLVSAADPAKVLLFGSHARGDADSHSDVDLIVVERTVENRFEETVRLHQALAGLLLPADILLVSEAEFDERSRTPGTLEHAAAKEGRVLYDAA